MDKKIQKKSKYPKNIYFLAANHTSLIEKEFIINTKEEYKLLHTLFNIISDLNSDLNMAICYDLEDRLLVRERWGWT